MFPLVALGFLVTGIAAASSSSCIGTISSLDDAGESITLLANTRSNPLDQRLIDEYDICVTGGAMTLPARSLYFSRYYSDVQDFGAELPYHCVSVQYLDGIKFGDQLPFTSYRLFTTNLSHFNEPFEPILSNTAIYLLGLSQQVSTFTIKFQDRPFRKNSSLYWGVVGASAVAFSGATDFMPELNRWLQIVEMEGSFKVKLANVMIADFVGC
ncbi:hypothetical protein BD769DRAFT_1680068 [Suillus cothurnatus]|nr:hypothetical protein BD769DRAFT_1680068 [Suillus cothurnatus]